MQLMGVHVTWKEVLKQPPNFLTSSTRHKMTIRPCITAALPEKSKESWNHPTTLFASSGMEAVQIDPGGKQIGEKTLLFVGTLPENIHTMIEFF